MSHPLADTVRRSGDLFIRYLAGFDETNRTRQAPGLPNHVAWTLGHLALTMHRGAERIRDDAVELAWDPEPFAFGSKPVDEPDAYPSLTDLKGHFEAATETLAAAIDAVGDAGLDREVPWGGRLTIPARDLVIRQMFHNGTHCGQVIDLRRALNLGGIM